MPAQPVDIQRNARFNIGKRRFVTGFAQARQISLRKALVLALERFRERHIFDQPLLKQGGKRQFRRAVERPAAIDVGRRQFVELCARPVPRLKMPDLSG